MEGAATTVYAQGGRGNARLVAWEGERTVTFTMEDALISPEGFMILSGAGLIEAGAGENTIKQHITETVDEKDVTLTEGQATIRISKKPYLPPDKLENFAYVMFVKNGEIISEPFIPEHAVADDIAENTDDNGNIYFEIVIKGHGDYVEPTNENGDSQNYVIDGTNGLPKKGDYDSVIVDYYTEKASGAQQIEITADKFGGNYYLEASTLFRDQNGVDMPAEFIIPNCKIQSNFTFTMASSGDPSTFTFTMDAFPDYTRFDHSKKVLAAIQIIEEGGASNIHRTQTVHDAKHDAQF